MEKWKENSFKYILSMWVGKGRRHKFEQQSWSVYLFCEKLLGFRWGVKLGGLVLSNKYIHQVKVVVNGEGLCSVVNIYTKVVDLGSCNCDPSKLMKSEYMEIGVSTQTWKRFISFNKSMTKTIQYGVIRMGQIFNEVQEINWDT